MKNRIFITGCAGFIGSQLAKKCLKNYIVIGVDNLDDYYSVDLKKKRISDLKSNKNFKFFNTDIRNFKKLKKITDQYKFEYVFHFAAQAGVRFSKIDPYKYTTTNILGTINLLNCFKEKKVKKIFLASSSSVYGESKNFPNTEKDKLKPINHYAYSKKINEETGYSYSKIYDLNIYMLRLFTVYGKLGRPDMFLFKLFKSIFLNQSFELNNSGNHERDFTYIEDCCDILIKLMKKRINKKFDIFNISSNNPINIKDMINFIQKNLIKTTNIKNIKRNKLDVKKTHGCNKKVIKLTKFKKFSKFEKVAKEIFDWYRINKIYKY